MPAMLICETARPASYELLQILIKRVGGFDVADRICEYLN